MDGTLVDTEPYWMEAEFDLAEQYGGRWTHEHGLALVGNDLLESGRYILQHMFEPDSPGAALTPEQVVELLLDGVVARVEKAVPWRPGARELLDDLLDAGVPCALVTMSYQRFVDPILTQLPAGAFAEIVTGDRVSQGKPHPEPYLKAAAGLGLAPEECVAIEDSNTGATSAEAAGCTVLVVECHVPVAPGERRVFRDSLEGLTVDDVLTLR
ncbi:HAD family phosphatase [Nocardioides jejuensis]|uniref:HAD family phosphatase n=2 Tax=Nocardioides jejuensis TaxID=2502782 RepID=A0A4R1C041_9ACTN|nr:HAD family phosphatase [Nocardioides jejuensis]